MCVEIDGTPSFSKEKLTWTGGMHFKAPALECFADQADYHIQDGKMYITGNVSIYKDGMVYRGQKATYDTKTEMLDVNGMKSSLEPKAPLYYTSQNLGATKGGTGV